MRIQVHILYHLLDLFVFIFSIHSFELAEYIQMFLGSELIKQYVVLWAYSHELSNCIHVFEYFSSEDLCDSTA